MPWNMTLKHKELVGTAPNRSVRLVIEVSDGVNKFEVDWTFNSAEAITTAGIKAAVVNLINKEADLIAKFNDLDNKMNQPIATGI